MPRNGRMITKITHSALAKPPMSLLRKMSAITRKSTTIQAIHKKNHKKVQNIPSNG